MLRRIVGQNNPEHVGKKKFKTLLSKEKHLNNKKIIF